MSFEKRYMTKDWQDENQTNQTKQTRKTKQAKQRKPEKFVGLTINGRIMGEVDINNDTEIHMTLTNPKTKQVIKRLMILDNIPKSKMAKGINVICTDKKGKKLDKGWQIHGHSNLPHFETNEVQTKTQQ